MNNNILIAIVATLTTLATVGILFGKKSENFTLPSPRPSEWFLPQKYQADLWLTKYYPDQLSQPQCLSYNRGPSDILNFQSSSFRFWRF